MYNIYSLRPTNISTRMRWGHRITIILAAYIGLEVAIVYIVPPPEYSLNKTNNRADLVGGINHLWVQ